MGFFSELREAIKEGVEEGRAEAKEELAQEAAEKAAAEAAQTGGTNEDFLKGISYEEQFGVALAAPFRESIFLDWFTVFKSEDVNDEFPRHLYSISTPGLVEKSNLKDLKQVLKRDFEITDEQSALWAVGQMFTGAAAPSRMEFPIIEDKEDLWADWAPRIYNEHLLDLDQRKNALSLLSCMAAHATAASANVGYLSAETALILLSDLGVFIKSLYGKDGSWAEFGTRFLAANDIFELNGKRGMKALKDYVKDLTERPGSPWVNIPFISEGETPLPFDELVDLPLLLELYEEEELDAVEKHIEQYFGNVENVFHELASPDIHLDVAIIEPTEICDRYILVTEGAGAHQMNVPEDLHDNDLYRMELLTALPADWDIHSSDDRDYWPIGTLKAMCRYPIEEETWLGWGHTIHFGQEVFTGTDFVGYMLIMPLLSSADAQVCTLPDGSDVNFYQLIPLYQEEMDYKIEHGTDSLWEKFIEKFSEGYDGVIDPNRPGVV